MTISYNWLCEYLPETLEPEKLSKILTSVGLEVESLEKYESIKGGLKGLYVGEVLEVNQHPNADKLKLTKVNIGSDEALQIVCGASNVAVGQKVIVATIGTTIYPTSGEPLTMKLAKIRGEESFGMICAEDEIGLGNNHEGILVLPEEVKVGTPAATYFELYEDWIFEIGLTPNRMDAMSHYGVAKDVCAYLTHHNNKETKVKNLFLNGFKSDNNNLPFTVNVENTTDCPRYSAITIQGIRVQESPNWLKNKLAAIGVRSINNIVDITNYILHETGQPLHAFDFEAVLEKGVEVKSLPKDSSFVSLDGKERKLLQSDLMICNGLGEAMCMAGVFGGLNSGVKESTTSILLESACFNGSTIRKTSLAHGLRTDAASRFEKGVDISNTVNVLKRAALLIKEVAGGEISSDIVDVYKIPKAKTEVSIKYHYIKKISGKNYHPDSIKRILVALGFELLKEGIDELCFAVPFSKPDIALPADIVEEILRIDGLDSIEIPTTITLTPTVENNKWIEPLKNKLAGYLVGRGFFEIFTNSITNSKYFDENQLNTTVKMINNLSVDLDVMRPSMLETGLEALAYNINRKNNNLQFFEFGKTYSSSGIGNYEEEEHLSLYITGKINEDNWKQKSSFSDFFTAKGYVTAISLIAGIKDVHFENTNSKGLSVNFYSGNQWLGIIEEVKKSKLLQFDIKQPVFFVDIFLSTFLKEISKSKIEFVEIPKFPSVERDLAIVIDKDITFDKIESTYKKSNIGKLKEVRLFDIFESERLGEGKKSIALNFTFLDTEKTLTEKEIETMTQQLIHSFETNLGAEIRKS